MFGECVILLYRVRTTYSFKLFTFDIHVTKADLKMKRSSSPTSPSSRTRSRNTKTITDKKKNHTTSRSTNTISTTCSTATMKNMMNSIPTEVQLQIYDFYLSRIKYEHECKVKHVNQMLRSKDIKQLVYHGHLRKIGTQIPFDWNDVPVNDVRLSMFRKRYDLLKDYCEYMDITKWRIRIPSIEMMNSKKKSKRVKKNQQEQQQDGDTIDVYLIYINVDESDRAYRKPMMYPSKKWKGFFDVRTYQQLAMSCDRFNAFNEMKSQPMEEVVIPLIEMYAEFFEYGGYDEEVVEELASRRDEISEQEYHHELHSFSEYEEIRSLILQNIEPHEN